MEEKRSQGCEIKLSFTINLSMGMAGAVPEEAQAGYHKKVLPLGSGGAKTQQERHKPTQILFEKTPSKVLMQQNNNR